MTGVATLTNEFVEYVPDDLSVGVLYVCMQYATVVHLCCCGCGNQVVTPLSPTDWSLIYNGEAVTLHPSIGNWSFPCQSHYWIRGSQITWAGKWMPDQIAANRTRDRRAKEGTGIVEEVAPKSGAWRRIIGRLRWLRP
jgi:hypothetical protein